jgi:ribosomal protein S18 acetylase RimI-like enzyme
VLDVLTLAFASDPPNRWMYPDARAYLQNFPKFAQALGGGALATGTAFMTRDGSGVILWLAPESEPDEEALGRVVETLDQKKQAVLGAVVEQMARYHPHEPHWYLPFIGVDPAHQGRGIGDALLKPMLAKCDEAGLPAYLESTTPKNQPLYRRHGFEAVGEIRVGDCPVITPMLRRPR